MKYITVFEESGDILNSENYVECLAEVSKELGIIQQELYIVPDKIDGNQYDEVYSGHPELNGKLVATIYTEEQYARIRR